MAETPKYDIDRVKTLTLAQQKLAKQGMKLAPMYDAPMKPKDYAPADISPHGDLGILDDKEQRAFFPRKIRGADGEWHSSKHLPMGKVRTMGDTETAPRVDRNAPVYPQHDKKDYSGMRAGGKVATQRRGVTPPKHASEGGHEGYHSA